MTNEASNPTRGALISESEFKNCAAFFAVVLNSFKKPFTCCGFPLGLKGNKMGFLPSAVITFIKLSTS